MPKVGPRARRVVVVAVVVVVAGGGAAAAWAATRPAGAAYRMAVAGPATVTDMLNDTGTIQPVSQATVTFPMSGQVQSVSVQLGQQVTVGQTLAQLNTTSLNQTVSSDQSAVATAQARLATDQTSQTSVTPSPSQQTTSPSSAGTGTGASGTGSGASGKASSGASSQLAQLEHTVSVDQNAVRQAQQKADKDLQLVTAADHQVNAQGAACQDLLNQLTSAGQQAATKSSTSSTSSSTSDTSTTTSPPATTPTNSTSVADCEALINAALADETTADNDEHALSTAVAKLATDLNKVVAAVGQSAGSSGSGSGSSGSGSAGSSHGSSGSGSSGSSSGSGSSGSRGSAGSAGSGASGVGGGRSAQPASADQIAADQASVDAANAQLAAAQQDLAGATLVSPIAGTVADVTITAGQSASANSSSTEIVIIGPGQDEVTTAVDDNEVGQVKPGENATVTPDGATKPITGRVTEIGALGTTTSSGSASYPVTVSLDSTSQQLFDGATASVGITLGTAQASVTVPTSAIHNIGGFSVVSKMVDGKPTLTRITTGVQGPTVTQVTSGLQRGDQVELADASLPMPTSTNTPGAGRAVVGGGFGGGGAFRVGGGAGGGAGGGRAGGGGG
jgi:HlyD family secretion protein